MLIFIFSIIEFVLFNFVSEWFVPNLLLLLIIFFNLYLGIRFSLYIAILAGLLMDSLSMIWGIHLVSFILCAYMTIVFKHYLFHMGSRRALILLVFFVTLFYSLSSSLLRIILMPLYWNEVFFNIVIPEIAATLLVSNLTFKFLRLCVLKLSV